MPAPPEVAAQKDALRTRLLAARRERPADEIADARTRLCAVVLSHLSRAIRCVGAYEPLRTEPGSGDLLAGLAAAGLAVLLPVRLPDNDLDWVTRDERDSSLGVAAIGRADLVLVPALAVDRRGNRLGRGGGSYDRALTRTRPGTPIVALIYDDELLADVPCAPWDRPVDAAVTPSGWHPLGAAG